MLASVQKDQAQGLVNRNVFGHFSEHLGRCVYEGYWVEGTDIPAVRNIRQDTVQALRELRIPVLRWPGGCFADDYHWMDGVGPAKERPTIVNMHWGGVTENNHFGTDEFMDLCAQLGCAPYICGNVGSGTVREMRDWVEYVTFAGRSPMADLRAQNGREEPWALPYFGVGNETWGCGGHMRPEYYADEYRRYACYVRNMGGNKVEKIACGANSEDYNWTRVLMREAGRHMDGLSLHYYTVPRGWGPQRGYATGFEEAMWYDTLRSALHIDELITRHSAIMDEYDKDRRVNLVVDEWGTWYNVEPGTNPGFLYQQSTMRDALVAGLTLHIFARHHARVRMANIAQTINVLQAVLLTDGPRMIKTPTYHVFRMLAPHMDAAYLPVHIPRNVVTNGVPQLSAAASLSGDGSLTLTLCNASFSEALPLTIALPGVAGTAKAETLCAGAPDTCNTFEEPDAVAPAPLAAAFANGALTLTLPAASVTAVRIA